MVTARRFILAVIAGYVIVVLVAGTPAARFMDLLVVVPLLGLWALVRVAGAAWHASERVSHRIEERRQK